MIDAKTLHIGSHVMVSGVRARVTDIDSNYELSCGTYLYFTAIINGEKRSCGGFDYSDKIEPIPITEELLRELGFEKREDYWRKFFRKDVWMYLCEDANNFSEYNVRIHYKLCSNCSFACASLHELEAMFYLTTKTELIED